MDSYFEWLQGLPLPAWISESESIWGFPLVLFLHSLGMCLSVGAAFVIGLRLLGVGRPMVVSSMRLLSTIFWAGFVLNLVSGSLLFAARATTLGYIPIYYVKLALILAGVLLAVPIGTFVGSAASDEAIPTHIKALALLSIVIWLGVITTGRFIAYLS